MTLEHNLSDCKNRGMLIPFGLYKNSFLHEVSPGEILETMDDPPVRIRVLAISVVQAKSESTNAISMLLYGQPIESIMDIMRRNWKHEVGQDSLFLLTYDIA